MGPTSACPARRSFAMHAGHLLARTGAWSASTALGNTVSTRPALSGDSSGSEDSGDSSGTEGSGDLSWVPGTESEPESEPENEPESDSEDDSSPDICVECGETSRFPCYKCECGSLYCGNNGTDNGCWEWQRIKCGEVLGEDSSKINWLVEKYPDGVCYECAIDAVGDE